MKYNIIRDRDISNGVGIACSVFFQGCSHRCKGCFNEETWDFDGGHVWTPEIENKFIELSKSPFIKCISLLGGEPFDQPSTELYNLLDKIHNEVGKPVFIWSGYTLEELLEKPIVSDCFRNGFVDVLIDGEFQLDKRDLRLKLRGSSNQRVIDVKKTLDKNEIVWYNI